MDIEAKYNTASFFVVTSEFEGFCIALVEALAHGLPVIGFEACNGPNEIIRNKVEGFLVRDESERAHKIELMMTIDLEGFRKKAIARAKNYLMEKMFQSWNSLLITMMNR